MLGQLDAQIIYKKENNTSNNVKQGQKIDIKALVDKAGGSSSEFFEQEVVINQKIFSKYSVENIDKLRNAKILTPEGGIYSIKEFEILNDDVKVIGAEVYPNCYIDVKKRFSNFVSYLNTKIIENDEIVVTSLVTNFETNDVLSKGLPNNHSIFTCKNESEFREQISRHKHKTLFMVGHIENAKFVNKSPNGEVIFEIEVERLLEIAADLEVNILPFGCFSSQYSPSGMTSEINSLKTIEILSYSMQSIQYQNSKNKIGDLLNELGANSETKLLIDEQNFKNQKYGKYKKIKILKKEGSKWILVAIVHMIDFPDDEEEYEEDTTFYWIKQKSPYVTIGTFLTWFLLPNKKNYKIIEISKYIISLVFWYFSVALILSLI